MASVRDMGSYCFTAKRYVTVRELRICFAIHNMVNIKGTPKVSKG